MAQAGLTWRLAVDLLDKMNNPDNHQHYSEVDDDDLEVKPNSIAYTFKNSTFKVNTFHCLVAESVELKNYHSLSNLMQLYLVESHGNTERLSAVNVNTTACFAEVSMCSPCPSSWFSPSTLSFKLESTSHRCGSQRGGTSAFLKDHCASLPLTAAALCWPRWMKKTLRAIDYKQWSLLQTDSVWGA